MNENKSPSSSANESMEQEWADYNEQESQRKMLVGKTDIISSILMFFFGIFVFWHALQMPVEQLTGNPDLWYAGPGFFPMVVSVMLMVASVFLFLEALHNKHMITKSDLKQCVHYFQSKNFFRLIIAAALLAVYIFLFLQRLNYYVGTFLYLFSTMIIFQPHREDRKKYIKSIILYLFISIVVTFIVGYGFSRFAQIPLP